MVFINNRIIRGVESLSCKQQYMLMPFSVFKARVFFGVFTVHQPVNSVQEIVCSYTRAL